MSANFVKNFQAKPTLELKKAMDEFQRMVKDLSVNDLSLYRCDAGDVFQVKLAAGLSITSGHIDRTTFWKIRIGPDHYVMTCGAPTGISEVDDAHVSAHGFTEDELVEMLEGVDLKEDLVRVERREIIDELRSQISGNPDIISHFRFSNRSLRELGL